MSRALQGASADGGAAAIGVGPAQHQQTSTGLGQAAVREGAREFGPFCNGVVDRDGPHRAAQINVALEDQRTGTSRFLAERHVASESGRPGDGEVRHAG